MSSSGMAVAKPRKIDFSKQVTVIVGPGKQHFRAPSCLLIRTSNFFQACGRGGWRETTTKTVQLPEVDAESFSVYLQWLYTGIIIVSEESLDEMTANPVEDQYGTDHRFAEYLNAIFKLAVLADKLGDLVLSNATVDGIFDALPWIPCGPSPTDVCLVYEALPDSSPFRRLVVDLFCCRIRSSHYMVRHRAQFPNAFIFDVMIGLKKQTEKAMRTSGIKRTGYSYLGHCSQYYHHNDKLPACL